MKEIIIYTDGSSLGNPGPGGWACILKYGKNRKEISQGYKLTTNNRMELIAAIEALKAIKKKNYKIKLHSDSKYLSDAIKKGWLDKWVKNNWKRNSGKVMNKDLWDQLYNLLKQKNVEFIWIPAHSGIEDNERCDKLAKTAAQSNDLLDDTGYLEDQCLR